MRLINNIRHRAARHAWACMSYVWSRVAFQFVLRGAHSPYQDCPELTAFLFFAPFLCTTIGLKSVEN